MPQRFDQFMASIDCSPSELPFHFGGATQCGRLNAHNNNQDAMAVWSRTQCIVGVVCDGCSTSMGAFSNNEVGARLLSMIGAEIIGNACVANGVAKIAEVLPSIERDICERLLEIADTVTSEDRRDVFLRSFLMSTILAFVVDGAKYAILGCGDGFYAINGEINSLEELSGAYLAGRLERDKEWRSRLQAEGGGLQIHRTGDAAGVQSLMIGTDGFEELPLRFRAQFESLLVSPNNVEIPPGFWPGMAADYRSRFWQRREVEEWADIQDAHDDRTFLLMRRLGGQRKEAPTPCSVSQETTSPSAADSSPP